MTDKQKDIVAVTVVTGFSVACYVGGYFLSKLLENKGIIRKA